MKYRLLILAFGVTALCSACGGDDDGDRATVQINKVDMQGVGTSIGSIDLSDGKSGLVIVPNVNSLSPGPHGMHFHENPDCGPSTKDGKTVAAGAAGEHYDPAHTDRHEGPTGNGHLADLPRLMAGTDGRANGLLIAPRIKVSDIRGRALVIHAGDDNYADDPGGDRIACGLVP